MNRNDVTEKIITYKVLNDIKWCDVAQKLGLSKEWVTAGCLGQMTFNAEQAKIAEKAGAVSVMALERVPSDIRADGGVARMSDPKMIKDIQKAVYKLVEEGELEYSGGKTYRKYELAKKKRNEK